MLSYEALCNHLQTELSEEVGLHKDDINQLNCIGIVSSFTSNIGFVFVTTTNLTKIQIEKKFSDHSDVEMQNIVFVPTNEVIDFLSKESTGDKAESKNLALYQELLLKYQK